MDRYLCQLCHRIIYFGERHPCFSNKDEENVYSMPAFSALNETGSKLDELVTSSNDNSLKHFQAKKFNYTENSPKILAYGTDGNRQLSSTNSSKTKGQFISFFCKSSNTVQPQNPSNSLISDPLLNSHVFHSTANKTAILSNSSENSESLYSRKGDLHGAFRRKSRRPDLWKRKVRKENDSTSIEGACKETPETSEYPISRYSYTENDISISKSLERSSEKSEPLENVSAATNFLPSLACPSRLMETRQHEIIVSVDDSDHNAGLNYDTFPKKSNAISHKGGLNSIKFTLPIGVSKKFGFPRGQMGEKNIEKAQQLRTSEVESQVCDNKSNGFAEKAVSHISMSDVYSIPSPLDMNLEARRLVEDKRFICTICGKGFGRKNYLKVHYRTHTSEKPFSCDMCEYKGRRKTLLNLHRRVHTGERPFQCSECEKAIRCKSNLKRHYRLIHKRK